MKPPAARHRRSATLLMFLAALAGFAPLRAADKKDETVAWPEITEQERALKSVPQDPEADAVILRRTRQGKIMDDQRHLWNVLDYHWRMKILNDRGKRYAEVHIPSQKYSEVSGIEARTIKADGTVVPVAGDQIFEKLVEKGRGYKRNEFVFNFPAVEPGAILEYRYRRRVSSIIYIEPWFFAGPEFTLYSSMSQVVHEWTTFRILCDKCPSPEPDSTPWQEGKKKGKLLKMEMKDISAYREERLMPPAAEVSPRIEMVLKALEGAQIEALGREDNLFTDWDSVAKYARYYYAKAYRVDEVSMKQVVGGWTQGITGKEDMMKAVFRHVTDDFRYQPYDNVYAQTSSIADMLKAKMADNEGKAVLLVSALRAIGVPANIVLVVGKGKGALVTTYCSLSQFSHAMVAVPQPDNTAIWLDPTVTYVPYGFMPWQDSGAGALYITETGSALINLPQKDEPGGTRYQVTVKPRPDGKADIDVVAEFQGEDAIEMRQELLPAAESARTTYLQGWLKEVRPGAELKNYKAQDLEAIDKPLRLTMSLEAPELITKAEPLLLVRGCVLKCEGSNPVSRRERTYPFYVDRGWNEEQTVTIVPPVGMRAADPPKPASLKSALGTLTFSCSSQADGSMRCTRRFTAPRGRWPAAEQAGIRKMFDSIVEVDRTSVAFQEEQGAAAGGS
jgi:uncharacterized protein DUF3857/transglutaminase superfamily protein